MFHKYKECLQLLCGFIELGDSVFVGPDAMGEVVDGIDARFDWYHSIT